MNNKLPLGQIIAALSSLVEASVQNQTPENKSNSFADKEIPEDLKKILTDLFGPETVKPKAPEPAPRATAKPETPVQKTTRLSELLQVYSNHINKVFAHRESGLYMLKELTNIESTDQVRFPLTVVYTSLNTGKTYSRPLVDFHASMKLAQFAPMS